MGRSRERGRVEGNGEGKGRVEGGQGMEKGGKGRVEGGQGTEKGGKGRGEGGRIADGSTEEGERKWGQREKDKWRL
jgi:hypothetical protein